jgi:hypothetical protein
MITSSTMRYQTVNPATGQIGTTLTCITGTELKMAADAIPESRTRRRAEMRECLPLLTAQANTAAFTGTKEADRDGAPLPAA